MLEDTILDRHFLIVTINETNNDLANDLELILVILHIINL